MFGNPPEEKSEESGSFLKPARRFKTRKNLFSSRGGVGVNVRGDVRERESEPATFSCLMGTLFDEVPSQSLQLRSCRPLVRTAADSGKRGEKGRP